MRDGAKRKRLVSFSFPFPSFTFSMFDPDPIAGNSVFPVMPLSAVYGGTLTKYRRYNMNKKRMFAQSWGPKSFAAVGEKKLDNPLAGKTATASIGVALCGGVMVTGWMFTSAQRRVGSCDSPEKKNVDGWPRPSLSTPTPRPRPPTCPLKPLNPIFDLQDGLLPPCSPMISDGCTL